MEIVKDYPPMFDEIAQAFPVARKAGVLFSWGSRVYNPTGFLIPPYLIVHEGVHARRQGEGEASIRLWWSRYIEDVEFRLDEEIHAHIAELGARVGSGSPRQVRRGALVEVAKRLSSPLYGPMISMAAAKSLLKGVMADAMAEAA